MARSYDDWVVVLTRRRDDAAHRLLNAAPHERAAARKALNRARRNLEIVEAAQASAWTTRNSALLRGAIH